MILYDNLICKSGFAHIVDSLIQRIYNIQFPTGFIILLCRHPTIR